MSLAAASSPATGRPMRPRSALRPAQLQEVPSVDVVERLDHRSASLLVACFVFHDIGAPQKKQHNSALAAQLFKFWKG
jgi:hypothetical protein